MDTSETNKLDLESSEFTLRDKFACEAPMPPEGWLMGELYLEGVAAGREIMGSGPSIFFKDRIRLEPKWRYEWADRMLIARELTE